MRRAQPRRRSRRKQAPPALFRRRRNGLRPMLRLAGAGGGRQAEGLRPNAQISRLVTKCNNYAELGAAGAFGSGEAEGKNGKNGAKNPEISAFLQPGREKMTQNRQNAQNDKLVTISILWKWAMAGTMGHRSRADRCGACRRVFTNQNDFYPKESNP